MLAVRTLPVSLRVRVGVGVSQEEKIDKQPRATPEPKEQGKLFYQNFLQKVFCDILPQANISL